MRWSDYIDEALERFGDTEVLFASHHRPVRGNARVVDFMKKQRDVYRYIHDQSVRMLNAGLRPQEIAETLTLPRSLASDFSVRGYYGTVRHNAKAVYQQYLGWFDGNPANLDPLPRAQAAQRYVELMGGADKTVAGGQLAIDLLGLKPVERYLDALAASLNGNELSVAGSRLDLVRFFSLIDKAPKTFPIVTP